MALGTAHGYSRTDIERIWEVLKSFASFGFCKAHAAAFALPTYHSAWLKAHHPAAFLAGVLTHDPGMYPKRLILDDARTLGIAVLGLDVNLSGSTYRIEKVAPWDEPPPRILPAQSAGCPDQEPRQAPADPDLPDGRAYGIRLSLTDVSGISEAEVARVVAGQPYFSLADFWHRARVSRPVAERLVMAGGFDSLYAMGSTLSGLGRRGRITRRDLLLHAAELDRWSRSVTASGRRGTSRRRGVGRASSVTGSAATGDTRALAASQSQGARPVTPPESQPIQLTLDLGDSPELTAGTGLPDMTGPERVRAELEVLGLDASAHVVSFYAPLLFALGVVRSKDLLGARSRSEILVCGVKVATQTPPVRSGRRVVFLTLDDSTGPVDATFFEDVQGPYAATVFHSWLLLVRGVVRRTGPRGISLRATGAWELSGLWDAWTAGGLDSVHAALAEVEQTVREQAQAAEVGAAESAAAGRRVLVHASGFKQSPYADVKPAGGDVRGGRGAPSGESVPEDFTPPRKLWHASPGSAGH